MDGYSLSLANSTQADDVAKIHHLFNAGGKALKHLASAVSYHLMNYILYLALPLVTKDISLWDRKDVYNCPVFNKMEFRYSSLLCWVNERTWQSIQDTSWKLALSSASRP